MFSRFGIPSVAGVCLSFLLFSAVAQNPQQDDKQQPPASSSPSSSSSSSDSWHNPAKYNPMKLIHRNPKSANDQLASNQELEQKLLSQLQAQGILEKEANLQDKCSSFKSLQTCVAVIRASKSLKVEFACLKWDVTGVKPPSVSDACAGPSDLKPMSFRDSISLLKPDCDAKEEAAKAMKSAQDDIKDASS